MINQVESVFLSNKQAEKYFFFFALRTQLRASVGRLLSML